MLEAFDRFEIKTAPLPHVTNTSDGYCGVIKTPMTAIQAIRALSAILIAAGVGGFIAGLQAPAIALLVVGVSALIFGFTLDKGEEAKAVLQSENLEEIKEDLTPTTPFELDDRAEINPVLQIENIEEVIPNALPPAMAFGKQAWIQYIGDPGEVPPLPANIDEILAQPCPFWGDSGRKVAQTHMLVLIPKTVIVGDNPAEPLTLRTFQNLLKSSNKTSIYTNPDSMILEAFDDVPIQESHWILMMKNVIYETIDQPYAVQERAVKAMGYEVPTCLDAAIAILLENMRAEVPLFEKKFTHCQRHGWVSFPIVGRFREGGKTFIEEVPSSLTVAFSPLDNSKSIGMAGMKKL